jgi:hypothetical protein
MSTDDVLKLPTADKRALLVALARELLPGGGPLVLDGDISVYRPVPNARALSAQDYRNATPEYLAELQRRAASPHQWVSADELVKFVGGDAPHHSPPPSERPAEATATPPG